MKKLFIILIFTTLLASCGVDKQENIQTETQSNIETEVISRIDLLKNETTGSIKGLKFTDVKVTREDSIVIFQIDGPYDNAASVEVLRSLNEVLDVIDNDKSILALVISGTGDFFSSSGGMPSEVPVELTQAQYAQATYNRLEHSRVPVIAGINGRAGQGGLELAMSTDIRIAAENATFSQLEAQFGLIAGFGGMERLPRLVGHSLAVDMMMAGRILNTQEALDAGLITRVVSEGQSLVEAKKLAKQIAETFPNDAIVILKQRLADSSNESFLEAMEKDNDAFYELMNSEAFQERLKTLQNDLNTSEDNNNKAEEDTPPLPEDMQKFMQADENVEIIGKDQTKILSLPSGFAPDGITIAKDGTIYVTSIYNGKIVKGNVSEDKIATVLVEGQEGRPGWGMDLSVNENHLVVAGGMNGTARVYETETGKLISDIKIADGGIVNDVIVTDHAAYFTNSSLAELYELALDKDGKVIGESRTIKLSGDFDFSPDYFANANGIEYKDGTLIVNHSNLGKIYTVDVETGIANEVDLKGELVSNDGIALDGLTYFGVEPPKGQVAELKLSQDLKEATMVRRFKSEIFDFPTLVAFDDNYVYIINGKLSTTRTDEVPYEVIRFPR